MAEDGTVERTPHGGLRIRSRVPASERRVKIPERPDPPVDVPTTEEIAEEEPTEASKDRAETEATEPSGSETATLRARDRGDRLRRRLQESASSMLGTVRDLRPRVTSALPDLGDDDGDDASDEPLVVLGEAPPIPPMPVRTVQPGDEQAAVPDPEPQRRFTVLRFGPAPENGDEDAEATFEGSTIEPREVLAPNGSQSSPPPTPPIIPGLDLQATLQEVPHVTEDDATTDDEPQETSDGLFSRLRARLPGGTNGSEDAPTTEDASETAPEEAQVEAAEEAPEADEEAGDEDGAGLMGRLRERFSSDDEDEEALETEEAPDDPSIDEEVGEEEALEVETEDEALEIEEDPVETAEEEPSEADDGEDAGGLFSRMRSKLSRGDEEEADAEADEDAVEEELDEEPEPEVDIDVETEEEPLEIEDDPVEEDLEEEEPLQADTDVETEDEPLEIEEDEQLDHEEEVPEPVADRDVDPVIAPEAAEGPTPTPPAGAEPVPAQPDGSPSEIPVDGSGPTVDVEDLHEKVDRVLEENRQPPPRLIQRREVRR